MKTRIKSLLVTAAALMVAVGVQAQGTIAFGNSASSSAIFLTDGATKATSTTPIWIGLFLNTVTTALTDAQKSISADLSSWIFSSPAVHINPTGAYNGGTRTINGVAGGTAVRAQVRIWSSAVGTTTFSSDYAGYLAAIANPGAFWAYQDVPNVITLATPPAGAPTLTIQGGILPTTLAPTIVPEPSLLALGLLGGLGTLVLIRRRK